MYTVVFRAANADSAIRAGHELSQAGVTYKVVNGQELAFRKVSKKIKVILDKHGLERVPTPPEPIRTEDLERLFVKHGRR